MSCATGNQVIRERVEKSNQVLHYAVESRKARILTDACINAGKKSIRAHRLILSCYSGYFRAMFQTEMEEKYVHTVTIEGVDETSLESLIEFIYTGKISINQENVFDLLAASDYLQIDKAKQFCFDFLFNSISAETCLKVLKVANSYKKSILSRKTVQFIVNNFEKVSSQCDFKSQSRESIFALISQIKTNRINERLVYDAIIGWVKHNKSRNDDFVELFQRLDLSRFSSSFLAKIVSTEPLVLENHTCSNLVMTALAVILQKQISSYPTKILSIGGGETENEVFTVYNNDHKFYPPLPQDFYSYCSLKLDDFVYCLGKRILNESTQLFKMKLKETNVTEWEEVAAMPIHIFRSGVAVFKNGIAVTGGLSYDECPFCVGRLSMFYIPFLDVWSQLPPTNKVRSCHSLVACNDCLYCLGGNNHGRHLSSVEMLRDANGTWLQVQPMQTIRSDFAAVNCVGSIYAIGGRNSQYDSMNSVEKYDSELNKWEYVKKMNIKRWCHSACVMQDKIFVVGGKNANDEFVAEIECYDPFSDNWSIVGSTSEKLYGHSIIAF